MRYLGNKTNLLTFIDSVIKKHNIDGEIFADLFAGTCSVGDYFKDKYTIIANDYMYFSKIIASAKLLNAKIPEFKKFRKRYKCSPFEWLNNQVYSKEDNYFVLHNYSPKGNRMYFTEDNAAKIDGVRLEIEDLYKNATIKYNEYVFLLASLLESALRVSNTSGTYQAYFKFWESRAKKPLIIEPLLFNETNEINDNQLYCEDTNKLVRKISGDIAYIDPPYTTTQYTNSYHVLETIARYDYPQIFGKTGRRQNRELSNYSNKQLALYEFEDLFRQLNFKHVLVSYSNQSIIAIDELVGLAKRFAVNGRVYVEKYLYREYSTNNSSYKGNGESLEETIIYFEKDFLINKSPLNYSGSKDTLVNDIIKILPKHVDTFVDAMGGAFNVGANIVAMNNVVYNEYNQFVFDVVKMLINTPKDVMHQNVVDVVNKYGLTKANKESYLSLRKHYNQTPSSLELFVLQIYAFQNMIRYNSDLKMNTPVGNNEYGEGIKNRIYSFRTKTDSVKLYNCSYEDLDLSSFNKDTVFYFDPPYYITTAEYNDGKRGMKGWGIEQESALLKYLSDLDKKGYKFILSNVLVHNGRTHNLLQKWIKEHRFFVTEIGKTGIKYPRTEVVITNFKEE